MAEIVKPLSGRFVFVCFFVFFATIVAVNTVFITNALNSHSGVVTKRPYEKGLAYNEVLEKARSQPKIENEVSYVDGVLRWQLQGVEDAVVSARIRRPVRDGYDFDIVLENKGNGVYEAQFNLPLPGQWTAILKSIWNNQQFQTTHELMAR